MTRPPDDNLRDLLLERAAVSEGEVERLRTFIAALPRRRSARRGLLAAAAGIILMLSVGGLVLVASLPLGASPKVGMPSGVPSGRPASPPASTASPTPASTSRLPAQIDPADCARMRFAADRCQAVVEAGLAQASVRLTDVETVSLAESPPSMSLGSRPIAIVTYRLRDGSSGSQEVRCMLVGGQYSLVCTDRPEIRLSAPYGSGGGYHDVPCGAAPAGEPGSACATPMPVIAPDAAAAAVPLEVASHDYPIAGLGPQEILIGRATLPNGILSDGRFSLADPFTRAFTVRDGVALVVRSLNPSRPPFDNIYAHGWYPGTEQVEVYLVFDVTALTPGASLEVRDLVVR